MFSRLCSTLYPSAPGHFNWFLKFSVKTDCIIRLCFNFWLEMFLTVDGSNWKTGHSSWLHSKRKCTFAHFNEHSKYEGLQSAKTENKCNSIGSLGQLVFSVWCLSSSPFYQIKFKVKSHSIDKSHHVLRGNLMFPPTGTRCTKFISWAKTHMLYDNDDFWCVCVCVWLVFTCWLFAR